MTSSSRSAVAAAAAVLIMSWILPVSAQQPAPAPATPPAAPQPAAPAPPQYQQSGEWSRLPRMQLERQFAGPLQDTVIQRWRDPVDGTVCYMYLPISVAHSPTAATGFVQYSSGIGNISCLPAPPAGRR